MYLVVGLGNPGEEHENTRHNLGFRVVEEVAQRLALPELKFKRKCNALVGECKVDDHKVIIAEPQTFMNLSGDAVASLSQWYKIPPDHLIVVHDDVDLEPGQIRVKCGGGAGGHHGIESIMARAGTPDFIRVRLGIGMEGLVGDVSGYVLEQIPSSQGPLINEAITLAADAVLSIVAEGLSAAMNKFNGQRAS